MRSMYKIDRRGRGGRGSKNRSLGNDQHFDEIVSLTRLARISVALVIIFLVFNTPRLTIGLYEVRFSQQTIIYRLDQED